MVNILFLDSTAVVADRSRLAGVLQPLRHRAPQVHGHNVRDPPRFTHCCRAADVVICEWANQEAYEAAASGLCKRPDSAARVRRSRAARQARMVERRRASVRESVFEELRREAVPWPAGVPVETSSRAAWTWRTFRSGAQPRSGRGDGRARGRGEGLSARVRVDAPATRTFTFMSRLRLVRQPAADGVPAAT